MNLVTKKQTKRKFEGIIKQNHEGIELVRYFMQHDCLSDLEKEQLLKLETLLVDQNSFFLNLKAGMKL